MSTDYYVTLSANNGIATQVKIIDSLVPLGDAFEADESVLGNASGKAVFGTDRVVLHVGAGAASVVILDGFTTDTAQNNSGTGTNTSTLGTFPDGDFAWHCDRVN